MLNIKKRRANAVVDGAPNYGATTTDLVTLNFYNAVVGTSLYVALKNGNAIVFMIKIKSRFITKDYVMQADTSLVVLSNINAKLSMTYCQNRF